MKWLIALLFAVTANASPQKIRVVLLDGPYALSTQNLYETLSVGMDSLSELPISLQIAKIRRFKDSCSQYRTLSGYLNQVSCLSSLKLRRFRRGLTVFVAPPLITNGIRYTAGVASPNSCYRHISRRIAVINATPTNVDGLPRIAAAGIAFAHETAHTFGASHDSSNYNIMHPDALALYIKGAALSFNQRAKDQAFNCPRTGISFF